MGRLKATIDKKSIDALKPGNKIGDTEARGLFVEHTPGGKVNFYWRRNIGGGRVRRRKIGEYPYVTIKEARILAGEWNQKRARDEIAELQEKKPTMTVLELWEDFGRRHLRELSKSTQRNYTQAFFMDEVKPLHSVGIDALTKGDFAELHRMIGMRSKPLANRVRAIFSSMLNNAKHWYDDFNNVPVMPKPYKLKERERFLSEEEIPKLLAVLDAYENQDWADYFRIVLFTGSRRDEVQSMRWDQLFLSKGVWNRTVKGDRTEPTALADPVIEILQRRRASIKERWDAKSRQAQFVFPSSKSVSGHIINPYKAWLDILDRAGLAHARIHDLRHTMGTWLAGHAGTLLTKQQLGHRHMSTTERYVHSVFKPVKDAVNEVVSDMISND